MLTKESKTCRNRPFVEETAPLFEASSQETALVEKLLEKMIRRKERIHRITRGERAVCLITEKGCGGTASNLFPNSPEELELLRSFEGKTLGEAAELLHHPLILCRSLGMAALGAGTPLPEMLESRGALEYLLEEGAGKTITIVGNFPFIPKLRKEAKTLHLLELREVPGAVPREEWEGVLKKTDVLGITGTAILTRSLAYFLEKGSSAFSVILGPSTPMMEVLFDYGAKVLAGSRVLHPEALEKGVLQGDCFRELQKKGLEHVVLKRVF